MPDYVILTDSSADLSAEMVREAGVTVLPLSFTIQGDLSEHAGQPGDGPGAVLRYCSGGARPPPPPSMWRPIPRRWSPCSRRGRMCSSWRSPSGLSTTCNSAEVAAEELREQYPQRKLYVVDTLCASPGAGAAGLAGRPGAEEGPLH